MKEPFEQEEFSFIEFIQNNIIQILLLGLVFVIVYVVDRLTYINNLISVAQDQKMMKEHMKLMKKGKKSKK
jgi:hypothetical protein